VLLNILAINENFDELFDETAC